MDPRAAREVEVGDRVDGRYALERAIARGGAGSIFEAEHLVTGERIAIKLLNRDLRNHSEARARLLREARALTLARHPNVVRAVDAGVDDDWGPFLVLELLEGRSLAGVIAARRRLDEPEAVSIGLQLCDALEAAHALGILHRDVKPHNVFIARDQAHRETAKLLDFGVAALRGERHRADPKLTSQGCIVGTPEYMAPEQLRGDEELDVRCDVYALGVLLFECVTGDVPFAGNFVQVLRQVWSEPPASLRESCRQIPQPLSEVLVRALARDRADRYASPRELADALRETAGLTGAEGSLLGIFPNGPVSTARPQDDTKPVVRPEQASTVAEEPSVGQRRRFVRVPYVTPVTVARARGSTIFGRSEDISEGGMLVLTGQPCDGPEQVTIRFVLPGTGRFAEFRATARWARQARDIGAVGFEFISPPESDARAIRQFVADRAARR